MPSLSVSNNLTALPEADHLSELALVREPSAVPVSLRSPAQVALKLPFALLDDFSVTDHEKLVQESADGIDVTDETER